MTAPTAPRYLHLTRLERLNAGLHHDSHPFLDRLSAERDDVADAELAAAARPLGRPPAAGCNGGGPAGVSSG